MHAAPSPMPVAPRPQRFAHAQPAQPTWQATATAMPQPVAVSYAHAHAVTATPAPAPAPYRAPSPAAQAMASSATTMSPVSYTPPPAPEPTLLQRITPVHMGVLLAIGMVMMVMTAGPASMSAQPVRLPAATVDGGGVVSGIPLPARSGPTAIAAAKQTVSGPVHAAAPKQARAAAVTPRVAPPGVRPRDDHMLRVGSATLNPRVRAGGIPSPAAAANLAIAGGGRVASNQTGAVRMNGIPSPAASEQLGPQKLPFRPTDGVTLPRAGGERDSHAVDTHYGAATLPMQEPAAPAMTPGAAAAQAERQVSINQVSGGSSAPTAPPAGGYALSF